MASRNDGPSDIGIGLLPLTEDTQARMIRLLLEHGADKTIAVEAQFIPFDLVKNERVVVRNLLKVPSRNIEPLSNHNPEQTKQSICNGQPAGNLTLI